MNRYSIFSLLRQGLKYHEGWSEAWRSPDPRKQYDVIIIGGGTWPGDRLLSGQGTWHPQRGGAGEGLDQRWQYRAQHHHRSDTGS